VATKNEPEDEPETWHLLVREIVETAMVVLGFVWIGLLVVELAYGLSPLLTGVFNVVWAVFILDFVVRLVLAKEKLLYLRSNWITAISLMIPAVRVLRVVRILRLAPVVRGVRMVRLLTSFNRSMRALGRTMGQRGFGYVVALTLIVVFAGAAGMYAFEREAPEHDGFTSYGDALWWTAMIITTLGSQYWPVTVAGRILCLFLALYAFTVFGYIAAVLASHFVGKDTAAKSREPGEQAIDDLRKEIAALREETRSARQSR
jgi:voltage-gated potassium channel